MLLRALRWLRVEAPFVAVIVILLAAVVFLVLEPGDWRPGAGIIAAAMLLAALLRLVLPAQAAGMLAVRGRWRDVVFYLGTGVVILSVALRLRTNGSTG